MRLELLFNLEKPEIPQDYRKIFVSYLKNTISKCNKGEFYDRYFGNINQKDYSFAVILSKPQFKGDRIELENNKVRLVFTASDQKRTGLIFFSAFIHLKNKYFPLPNGNGMVLKKINQLNEQLIVEPKVVFRTVIGGGLLIREHNRDTNKDRYYTALDREFDSQMKQVLQVQARNAGFLDNVLEEIILRPLQCKKVIVKHFGVFVDATVGVFEMEAEPELLQYFYQAGLGSKHSQGFGLVDVMV